MYSLKEIKEGLVENGYTPTNNILFAAATAINFNKPIIIEGAPGTGKTSLAQTVAQWLNLPLIRMQFYEGLTADDILYDYDYQKQLLTIQAISATLQDTLKGKDVDQAIDVASHMNFYSENFLIPRPLLKSITSEGRCVLLLDEVDKASEEIEHTLLEFLEDYSISIPQLGTVHCKEGNEPIVFLTSNRFRELSEPLKRRCGYLYIEQKSRTELEQIISKRVVANPNLIKGIAEAILKINSNPTIEQKPSTAEAIDWANIIMSTKGTNFKSTIMTIAKTKNDYDYILKHLDALMPILVSELDSKGSLNPIMLEIEE
jgi:MoxR-like ATPase